MLPLMKKSWYNFRIVWIIKTRGRLWLHFFSCGLKCWTNSTDRHHHPRSSTGKNSSWVHLTFFSKKFFSFTKTKRCFSSEEVLFLKWSKWKLSCSYCLFVFKTWTRVSPCCRGKKNKGDPVSLLLKNTSAAATAWHVSPPQRDLSISGVEGRDMIHVCLFSGQLNFMQSEVSVFSLQVLLKK